MKQQPPPTPWTPDKRFRALAQRVAKLEDRIAFVVACLYGLGTVVFVYLVVEVVRFVRRLL